MLEMVTTFNEALPELEAESDLFQDSSDLQSQLQDLYDDYMDYCIESIQYVKQNPTCKFLPFRVNAMLTADSELHTILLFFWTPSISDQSEDEHCPPFSEDPQDSSASENQNRLQSTTDGNSAANTIYFADRAT